MNGEQSSFFTVPATTVLFSSFFASSFVNDGDRVKKGDKLIGFDIKYIQEHAKSDECMVVFTSLQEGEEIRMSKSGKVEKLEKTAEIVSLN